MEKHIALGGERLDQVHYAYYQTLEGFDQLLIVNRHLLRKPILENGDIVYLPVLVLEETTATGNEPWA